MMVSKFGELIWTALQMETLESIVGFNVSLSEVRSQSGGSQEAVRSQSGVSQELVRSLSGVCQGSVMSMMITTFGELIWTALQIESWCHLQQIS